MKEIDEKTTDKILEIMRIHEKYIPAFAYSRNYRYDIIQAIYSNPEYHDDWLGFIKFADEIKLTKEHITQTLMHDIGGLIGKDEFFTPRVSGYNEHLNNNK